MYVADRESDIQGLMEEARRRDYAADYLIRAKHNRKLTLAQASEMIDWYRRSRLIEIFFGFLKAAAVSQSTL